MIRIVNDIIGNRDEFRKEHEKKWGSFNKFPPGWKDVSDDPSKVNLIMTRQLEDSISAIESRQMYNRANDGSWGKRTSATLYFRNGGENFAVGREYGRGGWFFKYYEFGCQHERQSGKTIGNCLMRYSCKDCGISWTIDSSG